MKTVPNAGDPRRNSRRPTGGTSLASSYVRRLSPRDIVRERKQDGNRCLLDALTRAEGVRFPEGIVLGEEAHREFMSQSNLLEELHARNREDEGLDSRVLWLRQTHRSSPIEGELNREICAALVELGAPSVVMVSEGFAKAGLKSIPEVKDAVRDAWLLPEGLRRQVEAASRGEEEIPTWLVMILTETDAKWS